VKRPTSLGGHPCPPCWNKFSVPEEAKMYHKFQKSIALSPIFLFALFISFPIIISCGESKEMIRQKEIEKQQQEALHKKKSEINAILDELKNKYSNPIDLSDEKGCELFARAYNNPEENPKIENSTEGSENEFEYQKDKEKYKSIRSSKYAIMSFNIFGNELQKYDFQKKHFIIQFKSYTIMSPEGGVIYTKKRPPFIKLLVKGSPDIKINIEPELAENFKNGITDSASGMEAMYGLKHEYKDRAILYVIFKVNGKQIDSDIQHISVDIADYICFWYIDAGSSLSGYYGHSRPCNDPVQCSSDIKIFRK